MLEQDLYQYIRGIKLERYKVNSFDEYPFLLKAIRAFDTLELHPNVTFFVGENGSGKSTLLEAIAVAYGFNAEGGSKNFNFSTRESHSSLSHYLKIIKGARRPKDGYFLRAESFYNVASQIDSLDEGGGGARIIDAYGGISLHKQSHGESFMSLLMNRLGGNGIYILDEPEAALSPTRQMAMLSRMHELVKKDSQFIIATHSPIIMSYPNASIYNIDNNLELIKYKTTEHFQVMNDFINNTDRMLGILLDD